MSLLLENHLLASRPDSLSHLSKGEDKVINVSPLFTLDLGFSCVGLGLLALGVLVGLASPL